MDGYGWIDRLIRKDEWIDGGYRWMNGWMC